MPCEHGNDASCDKCAILELTRKVAELETQLANTRTALDVATRQMGEQQERAERYKRSLCRSAKRVDSLKVRITFLEDELDGHKLHERAERAEAQLALERHHCAALVTRTKDLEGSLRAVEAACETVHAARRDAKERAERAEAQRNGLLAVLKSIQWIYDQDEAAKSGSDMK